MARLVVLEGFHNGQSFALSDDVLLGRNPDNYICLPEKRVSRQHARIRRQGNTFAIEDLNSTNGVLVQGKRIPPQMLHNLQDGDEIIVCSTRFLFRAEVATSLQARTERLVAPLGGFVEQAATEIVMREEVAHAIRLHMLSDEENQPQVAAKLDASINFSQLNDDEKHSDKGLQDALKRLQAMCRVSTVLGTITDRETLLQKIIDCIFEIFSAAERTLIMLRDVRSGALIPVTVRLRSEATPSNQEVPISRTIVNEVVAHKRSILSYDVLDDTRFNQTKSILNLSMRSMMCAPFLVGEEILGLIQVDTLTMAHGFAAEDLQILTGISTQAAMAIKNLQLYEAIETETTRRISLQRSFSPGLVEKLMTEDVSTALGGHAYHGTILFSEIIGFTAMSEHMAPAHVVAKLNRYCTIMQKLIHDHGGNIDKCSGEAVMAFWGVPHNGPHDEADAVLAAIRMQEKLWPFNLQLQAEGQQPIHMGIGLTSGEFIAGNIGSSEKIDFTLIGDTVHLAARIEGLASRYQVLITEATWEPIQHLVCAVRLPPVPVKGKAQPVTIYSIRAMQDRLQGSHAVVLLCYLLDTHGEVVGQGLILHSFKMPHGVRLHMYTTMRLTPAATLTLRLILPEYHDTLTFTALVDECTILGTAPATYTHAVIHATDETQALAFLTPGSCLVTARAWRPKRM